MEPVSIMEQFHHASPTQVGGESGQLLVLFHVSVFAILLRLGRAFSQKDVSALFQWFGQFILHPSGSAMP